MTANLLLTTITEGHRHFAYWTDNNEGMTSMKNGHQHQLVLKQIPKKDLQGNPIVDPNTQQPIIENQVVAVAVQEGEHQHLVTSMFNYKRDKPEAKDDVYYLEKLQNNKDKSKGYDDTFFYDNAKEAEKFRVYEQWNKDIIEEMDDDQSALTIGVLNSSIDVVCGYQQQNYTEPKVIPIEGGDSRAADVFDQLLKHILDSQGYHFKKSEVFDDQISIGRGFLDLKIDRQDDYRGEFKIEKVEWDLARLGIHNKKDGSDAKHGEKIRYIPLDELKELYPEKESELDSANFSREGQRLISSSTNGETYRFEENQNYPVTISTAENNISNGEVEVVESQWLEYRRIPVAFNMIDGLYQPLKDISKEDLAEILTIDSIQKVEIRHSDVRTITACGNIVLSNEISEIGTLSLFPFYGKKYKEKVFGKFFEGMDMQKEINFSHSYIVDTMNTSLRGATWVEKNSMDPEEEERFMEEGTKRGYTGFIEDINRAPKKDRGEDFPQGRASLENMSSEKLQQVTNINNAMLGIQNSANESNMLMLGRQKQGLLGLQYLFTHQQLTERRLIKTILKNIPKIYTPDRILRILDNRHLNNKFQNISGMKYSDYTKEELLRILSIVDITQYDLEITESMATPTRKQYRFAIWKEIYAQSGGKYPIEWLIKISDDITETEKQEFFAMLDQNNQAASESELNKIKTQGAFNLAQEKMKQNANENPSEQQQVTADNMGSGAMVPQ